MIVGMFWVGLLGRGRGDDSMDDTWNGWFVMALEVLGLGSFGDALMYSLAIDVLFTNKYIWLASDIDNDDNHTTRSIDFDEAYLTVTETQLKCLAFNIT